jgi:hypothetical protein
MGRAELAKADLERANNEGSINSFLTQVGPLEIKKTSDGRMKEQYYVDIPKVISLTQDGGVYFVETEGGDEIYNIPPHQRISNKNLRYGAANRRRSGYSRVKDKLYLTGNTESFYSQGKIFALLLLENTTTLDLDEEYPIDGSLLPLLMEEVEQIARREMYGSKEDESNDGKQQTEQ